MIRGGVTAIGGAGYLAYHAFPLLASAGGAAAIMGVSAVALGKLMS